MSEGYQLAQEIIAELLTELEKLPFGGRSEDMRVAMDTAELYLMQREWYRNSIDNHWQNKP